MVSFAQQRIFLDEQVRFSNKVAIYNELIVLRVIQGSLSTDRLAQALRYVLSKHKILRTSLIFNNDDSAVKQHINNNHQSFLLVDEQKIENEFELLNIIHELTIDPILFDLSSGRVFHCEIVRQQNIVNQTNDIESNDILIVAFHHAAFDRSSRQIFFNDLLLSYNNNSTWSDDVDLLQYIDYSVHERSMDMTSSREFWHSQLEGYNLNHQLSLPLDRHRLSSDQRSSLASVAQISFDKKISTSFINYASSQQTTPFQLGLAIFYAFLFKLTYGETDLCISCLNANRYRSELQDMIGMFVAVLPYRLQLDSSRSFDKLVKHVQEKCLAILEHSHYPLQHILTDSYISSSNNHFLETIFDLITVSSNISQLLFDETIVEEALLQQSSKVAKFDFSMTFIYNPTSDDNVLSCFFVCSRDVFEETTIARIAQRFQRLFEQIFATNSNAMEMNQTIIPINKLSLILPEEAEEMQTMVFCGLPNTINEGT